MRLHLFSCFILTFNALFSQELPGFIQQRVTFCDVNFPEEVSVQLLEELDALESYFVNKGLLETRSGASYRAVYKQIAAENDLNFEIEPIFELLDSLSPRVSTLCFYKLLTREQLARLNPRHETAAERITAPHDGDLTPGIIARRITEHLTDADFDLAFYRISSLLTFYRIAYRGNSLGVGLPDFSDDRITDLSTLEVFLDENSQVLLDGQIITHLKEVREAIRTFISLDPYNRGVEFSASRSASYEAYMETTEVILSTYAELQAELGDIPKNVIIKEPK